MPHEQRLRQYLKGRFRNYHDGIGRDESLEDVVDSLGLFELLEFVEREFEVSIPTARFAPQRFHSIQRILDFVEELRVEGASGRCP